MKKLLTIGAAAATPRRGSLLYRKQTLKAVVSAAAICVAAALPSWAEAKEATLMLAGYTGTTTLTNFQALVKLQEGRFGFSYNDYAAKDGTDLWFTDSSGIVIPHEIDTWNDLGDSYVWVRVPEVSGSDTKIVMHWGAAKTAAQTATENAWKNYNDGKGGFAGVWHMKVNLGDETDAAGNGLTATRGGNRTGQMTTTSGVVGLCRVNQTELFNSNNGNGLDVSGYDDYITDVSRFTLSGWFRATEARSKDNWTQMFSSEKWRIRGGEIGQFNIVVSITAYDPITASNKEIASPAPSALPSDEGFADTWCYLVLVFDGTSCRLYANGKSLGSWTDKTAVSEFAESFRIGNSWNNTNRGWYGKYDEVRLYDGAQSEDRVKADYATMNAPETFITVVGSPTAEWTGAGNDGDIANSANWDYRDASGVLRPGTLPDSGTVVTIAGNDLYIAASTNVSFASLETRVGNCTLGADCDIRGLGDIVFVNGTTVDMNGHTFKIPSFSGANAITNSAAGDPAELYVYVASDAELNNTMTAIDGNIKFIKEGAGKYYAAKVGQTYTGGTLVKYGEVWCAMRGGNMPLGLAPCDITIDPDGVVDMRGHVLYTAYQFILNGGTLKNSATITDSGWTMWKNVRLTADSTIYLTSNYGFLHDSYAKTTLDLDGHRLTVTLGSSSAHLMLYSTEILNGIIETDSGGYIHSYSASKNDIGSTTFDLDTATALNLERDMVVRDYTARNKWTGSNAGNALIKVHGTFKPMVRAENCFHGCIMQADSTIDLSVLTNALPLVSRFTNGANTLQFVNDTTVNIKLGTRSVSRRTPIISWTSKPDGINTVKFKSATGERQRSFVVKDDGLYALSGLIISFH